MPCDRLVQVLSKVEARAAELGNPEAYLFKTLRAIKQKVCGLMSPAGVPLPPSRLRARCPLLSYSSANRWAQGKSSPSAHLVSMRITEESGNVFAQAPMQSKQPVCCIASAAAIRSLEGALYKTQTSAQYRMFTMSQMCPTKPAGIYSRMNHSKCV